MDQAVAKDSAARQSSSDKITGTGCGAGGGSGLLLPIPGPIVFEDSSNGQERSRICFICRESNVGDSESDSARLALSDLI